SAGEGGECEPKSGPEGRRTIIWLQIYGLTSSALLAEKCRAQPFDSDRRLPCSPLSTTEPDWELLRRGLRSAQPPARLACLTCRLLVPDLGGALLPGRLLENGKHIERALRLQHKRFRAQVAALDAAEFSHAVLQFVITIGGLACVRVAGGAFAWFGLGYVHIVRRRELQCILAIGDL